MTTSVKHLGMTRSEKSVDVYLKDDLKMLSVVTSAYTSSDHFDAYALFQHLVSRQLRRFGRDAEFTVLFDRLAQFHYMSIEPDKLMAEMSILSLTTIFDIVKYGKSRADAIFQD